MNFRKISLAAMAGLLVLMASSCLKDDSEEKKAEEKKILQNYLLNNNITVEPTESGLYYIETLAGTGDSARLNTWMEINYTCRLVLDNSVVMTSNAQVAKDNGIFASGVYYGPARLILGQISYKGLNEGIAKMREGGKARLIFASDLGLGAQSTGTIPEYSSLIFDIELVKVIPDIHSYETGLMMNFLEANEVSTDSTDSGIYFKQIEAGTGDFPDDKDVVTIEYSGSFLSGAFFDNSGNSYTFTIGKNEVIKGFEDGVKLIQKNGKGLVVIPFYYAYGEYGRIDNYYRTVIPPFSTLVFTMKVTYLTKF